MKIAYITGLSHSGSTLLDLMLGAHSQCFSVGELKHLGHYARQEMKKNTGEPHHSKCTCGAKPLLTCPFWSQVDSVMRQKYSIGLSELETSSTSDSEAFRQSFQPLYQALFEVSGADVLVDSSKQPGRLPLMRQLDGFEVIPIHIYREPKGQIYSQLKKGSGLFQSVRNYNTQTREILETLNGKTYIPVSYEVLAREPVSTVSDIMAGLGLTFEETQMNWSTRIKHNVGGNRMRKKKDNTITPDESWSAMLNPLQRLYIDVATRPIRKAICS